MKNVIRYIGIALFSLFFFIMKYTSELRHSIFFILLIIALTLWYQYENQKTKSGKWYVHKPILFAFLCVFIIPVLMYTVAATNFNNYMIVGLATLIAVVAAILLSLRKGDKDNGPSF